MIEEFWKKLDIDDKIHIGMVGFWILVILIALGGVVSCAKSEGAKSDCLDRIAEEFCAEQGHSHIDLRNGIGTFNCMDKETRAISDNYRWSASEYERCKQ